MGGFSVRCYASKVTRLITGFYYKTSIQFKQEIGTVRLIVLIFNNDDAYALVETHKTSGNREGIITNNIERFITLVHISFNTVFTAYSCVLCFNIN